jgi:O-antigen/teichoic acid export membrane protein
MKFFNNAIMPIVIMSVGIFALFYVEAIIGRALSPELYGDYRVVITVVMFLGQILLLGLDYVIIKYIPQLLRERGIESAKFFLIGIFKVILCIILLWEIFSLLVDQSAHNLMFSRLIPADIHPGYFYLSGAGAFALFMLILKTTRALNYRLASLIMYYSWYVLLLGFMLVIPITLDSAIVSTVASYLISAAIFVIPVFVFFNKVRTNKFSFPKNVLKDALHFTTQQMFAFQIIGILLILMEGLSVAEDKIGIFSATMMIANLGLVITGGIKNSVQVPIIFAMQGQRQVLRRLLLKIYMITAVSAVTVGLTLYFLTPMLLRLYGIRFNLVLTLIPFALMGNVPGAIVCGDMVFINYFSTRSNKIFTYLMMAKTLLTVLIGIFLIKFFDMYGAIASYIMVETLFAIAVMRLKYVSISK